MKRLLVLLFLAASPLLSGCETLNRAIAEAAARSNPTEPDFKAYKVLARGKDYTTIAWHNESGAPIEVDVYPHKCGDRIPAGDIRAEYERNVLGIGAEGHPESNIVGGRRVAYLCSLPGSIREEVDHHAGMRHGEWKQVYVGQAETNYGILGFRWPPMPGPVCAKITAPAYGTDRYQVGDSLCVSAGGLGAHYGAWTSRD